MGDQQQQQPCFGGDLNPFVDKILHTLDEISNFRRAISFPRVVFVGCQSSGKSSVLEALVGRDFMPRASTRRPLVLKLHRIKPNPDAADADAAADEYGEFSHIPGRRFYDFNDIRTEIQAETEREAGGSNGFSDKEIQLKIFSPNFLDITLVDLPGITKVPLGDQPPSDIEARIRTMIMSYVNNPNCLILAVTPAADLVNSDALQIAKYADPEGLRTFGVVTKLDITDIRGDAVTRLPLGYVGVVNRSQEDVLRNRTVKDALAAEEAFFRSRPDYNRIAERRGVRQLAKKLNQILVCHLRTRVLMQKARTSARLAPLIEELGSFLV